MKILEQEVKTVYTVSFDEEDFNKASTEIITHSLRDIVYKKAFKKLNNWDEFINSSPFNDERNNIAEFIVKEILNFNSIENCGHASKDLTKYIVVVSNKGDCINE